MNLYRLTKDNSIFQNIGFVTHITQTFDIVTLTTSMNFIIDYIIDLLFSLFYFYYSYQYKRIKMIQSKNNFVNSTLLRQITNQWLEWCRSKTSTLFFFLVDCSIFRDRFQAQQLVFQGNFGSVYSQKKTCMSF